MVMAMEMKMMMTLITHLRLVASPGTVKSEAAPSKVTCKMGLIIIIYIYNHDYLYFSLSILSLQKIIILLLMIV